MTQHQQDDIFGRSVSAKRYEPALLDLNDANSSRAMMVELTGSNKSVLEIGTSTGYMTRVLQERGNRITGVEIDQEAARVAEQYCERMLTADIESALKADALSDSSFDVIIVGDVLEHLRWPNEVLERLKRHLRPGGYLVVSLPNVSHGDVILNLLQGQFPYQNTGLLDITHFRFFGLADVVKLFSSAGYEISELRKVKVDVGCTETSPDLSTIPPEVLDGIRSLPHGNTYQFVFKAFRRGECSDPLEVPANELTSSFEAFTAELRRLRAYLAKLQPEFEAKARWADSLNQEAARLRREFEVVLAMWRKATRWRRMLASLAVVPLDIAVAVTLVLVEGIGRTLRAIKPADAPVYPVPKPECSFIIVSWNGKHLLAECLPRLLEAIRLQGGNHEIVVVDNGSIDGTSEFVRENFPEINVVRSEQNLYFGGGNRLGIKGASKDILVLLNNDMMVEPDFLEPLLQGFRDTGVFGVASQVFLPADKKREETGKTRAEFNGSDLDWRHDPISAEDQRNGYTPVFWLHGGATAIDRRKYEWLGGLDQIYDPFYVEDADLSYRAWKVGWRCLLACNSRVLHQHRSSTQRFGDGFIRQIVRRNHYIFLWKNLGDIGWLIKHFIRAARARVRRAGVPGIGIQGEAKAYFGALKRLPTITSSRLKMSRSIRCSDRKIIANIDEVQPAKIMSTEVDFARGDFDDHLAGGWYTVERDHGRPYRWMGDKASVYLARSAEGDQLVVEGCAPSLSNYGGPLLLKISINGVQQEYALNEGSFSHAISLQALSRSEPLRVDLALNRVIRKSEDQRTLGVMVHRVAAISANRGGTATAAGAPLESISLAGTAAPPPVSGEAPKRLLFICAYLPCVGLHGGGNTMFHLIRTLSRRYRITVLAFFERDIEQQLAPLLLPYCERLELVRRTQSFDAPNRFGINPPSIVYEFYHDRMQHVVDHFLRTESFEVIDCEYLQTGHFVLDYPDIPAVLSHHEMYSMSIRNRLNSLPYSWEKLKVFVEWMRMLNYEERIFRRFSSVLLVTEKEREYLHGYMPAVNAYAHPTGVDTDFFSPTMEPAEAGSVAFLGNFQHAPNVGGLLWFAEKVWPRIRARCPGAKLYAVGGSPPDAVQAMHATNGIEVTGWVKDVRPYLQRSAVFVAPMLDGVGLRGKILEAWATEKPVVATSLAFLGLDAPDGYAGFVADDETTFADRVCKLLEDQTLANQIGKRARELVVKSYSWEAFADFYDAAYRAAMRTRPANGFQSAGSAVQFEVQQPSGAGK